MSKKIVGLATAAMAGLFVVSTGMEPALARDGGGGSAHSSNSGGGGGGRSISGGGGGRSMNGGGRSMSSNRSSNGARVSGNRVYGYQAQGHNNHRGHRHRHRGIGVYGYGYSDDYGYYNGTCAYEYNRAVATGSAYWWNRYQECID